MKEYLSIFKGIFFKEIKIVMSYPVNFVGEFILPFTVFIPYLLIGEWIGNETKFYEITGTSDYPSFIVISSIFFGFIEGCIFDVGRFIRREIRSGTLELLMTSPVPRLFIVAGRFLSSIIRNTFINLLLFITAIIIFGLKITTGFFTALFIFVFSLPFLFGISCIFASFTLLWKRTMLPSILNSIFYTICGIMYPIKVLPKWCQSISFFIPYTYIFDAMRGSLLRTKTLYPMGMQVSIIFISGIIFLFLGGEILNNTIRNEIRKGTIGEY